MIWGIDRNRVSGYDGYMMTSATETKGKGTMEITYAYLEEGTAMNATWSGDPADAIRAAMDDLGAVECGGDEYRYVAEETGEAYILTRDEMIEAGAAILDGASDWYSLWCAGSGRLACMAPRP